MGYIASWFVSYAAAISVVIWAHGSVLLAGIASGLVLIVAFVCAAREARSASVRFAMRSRSPTLH